MEIIPAGMRTFTWCSCANRHLSPHCSVDLDAMGHSSAPSRKPEASVLAGFLGRERMKDLLRRSDTLPHFQPDNGRTLMRVGLGRLTCRRHACHVTVGCKLDPIGALLKSRLPMFTQLGAMACQGQWRVYVWLSQGLRCKCGGRNPDQQRSDGLVGNTHGSSPSTMLSARSIRARP